LIKKEGSQAFLLSTADQTCGNSVVLSPFVVGFSALRESYPNLLDRRGKVHRCSYLSKRLSTCTTMPLKIEYD
jgi:hypothetical protein